MRIEMIRYSNCYFLKRILSIAVLLVHSSLFAQNVPTWDVTMQEKLIKMADSLTVNLKPWIVPNQIFKVEDFGAKADGLTVNTLSIQNAIDSCSGNGGGVVLFSSGNYVTGTIELKSGVMLEIQENAKLLGSTKLIDYPEKIEQFKSVMSENHKYRQSLIYVERAQKVGIRGKGEIHFRGEKSNFPGTQTTGAIVGRPFGIRMIECSQVVLQDIYLHNAAAWMQSYLYCNDLIFDGINVVNQANFNNDGLDADGCTNLIVRNCFINSEDDAMCLKGCSNKPTQNVLIENSTFITTCNALKIGTDTQGPFRNIVCRNLILGGIPANQTTIAGNQASTGITLATVDGGNVENILISDVTVNQSRCPVFLRIGNRLRVMNGLPKPPVGYLKKVLIQNVIGEKNAKQGSFISGISNKLIEDVIIRNYKVSMEGGGDSIIAGIPVPENEGGYPDAHQFSVNGLPSYGFYVRHAKNITIEDAEITPVKPDYRPCFINGGNVANAFANGKAIEKQVFADKSYKAKYIKEVTIIPGTSKYSVAPAQVGSMYYTDRTFAITDVPEKLNGAEFICWPNDLKMTDSGYPLSFSVTTNGTIYVAHDDRLKRPDWLINGFSVSDFSIVINGAKLSVFEKKVSKDENIKLGANQATSPTTSQSTNYVVFFLADPVMSSSHSFGQPENLKIYPNPAKSELYIESNEFQYDRIEIFDRNGSLVQAEQVGYEQKKRLELSLPNGIYCLKISNNDQLHTRIFIIE